METEFFRAIGVFRITISLPSFNGLGCKLAKVALFNNYSPQAQ